MHTLPQTDKAKAPKVPLASIRVMIPREMDREVERAAFELDTTKRKIVEQALRLWLGHRRAA